MGVPVNKSHRADRHSSRHARLVISGCYRFCKGCFLTADRLLLSGGLNMSLFNGTDNELHQLLNQRLIKLGIPRKIFQSRKLMLLPLRPLLARHVQLSAGQRFSCSGSALLRYEQEPRPNCRPIYDKMQAVLQRLAFSYNYLFVQEAPDAEGDSGAYEQSGQDRPRHAVSAYLLKGRHVKRKCRCVASINSHQSNRNFSIDSLPTGR